MACPKDYPISGSMTALTSAFDTEAEARAAFLKVAQSVATQLAAATARCPESCECWKVTHIGTVGVKNVQITVDSPLGLGYVASGSFDWWATITCGRTGAEANDKFIKAFCKAAKAHARATHTVANGYWNDLIVSASWLLSKMDLGITHQYGEGCTAWSEWIRSWFFHESEWEGATINHIELPFPRIHKVELITCPDGTRLVFDPWRDPDNPIWDADEYEKRYGPWILFD
jgi:hypothetical protein